MIRVTAVDIHCPVVWSKSNLTWKIEPLPLPPVPGTPPSALPNPYILNRAPGGFSVTAVPVTGPGI